MTVKIGEVVSPMDDFGWSEMLLDGKRERFHCTCFRSLPPTRFPKAGDKIEAIYNEAGELVRVRER